MAVQRPVFVAITSSTCGHCHVYRANQRDKIVDFLKEDGRVEIVEIHANTSDPNSIGSQYHPGLSKLIKWFPIFFVFTGESWNDHNSELVGHVLGGRIENGTSHNVPENRPRHDFDGITGWVLQSLNNTKNRQESRGRRVPINKNNRRFPKGTQVVAAGVKNKQSGRASIPRSGRLPPRNPNIRPEPSVATPRTSNRTPKPSNPPNTNLRTPKPSNTSQRRSRNSNVPYNGPMTAPAPVSRGPTTSLRLPPTPVSVDTSSGGDTLGSDTLGDNSGNPGVIPGGLSVKDNSAVLQQPSLPFPQYPSQPSSQLSSQYSSQYPSQYPSQPSSQYPSQQPFVPRIVTMESIRDGTQYPFVPSVIPTGHH